MTALPAAPTLRIRPSIADGRFIGRHRYDVYARMRALTPVYWDARANCWVITGYAEGQAALKDARLSAERLPAIPASLGQRAQERYQPVIHALSNFILFLDEPRHGRIRALIQRAFTPRRVSEMRAIMEEHVHFLVQRLPAGKPVDLMSRFAHRVPSGIIAQMLDIPRTHHARFHTWSEGVASFLSDLRPSEEALEAGLQAVEGMAGYFRPTMARRRRTPGGDLLSALVTVEEGGQVLTEDEVISTAMILLAAGQETTAALLGSGVHLLMSHPEQLERLRADRSLIKTAIEEMLRFESPINMTGRTVRQSMTLSGSTLLPGQTVMVALGACNRDPAQFVNPDDFDVGRADNRHLAFSHGPHYCIGAMLSRVEAEVALTALLDRFTHWTAQDEDPLWYEKQVRRSLRALHVVLRE